MPRESERRKFACRPSLAWKRVFFARYRYQAIVVWDNPSSLFDAIYVVTRMAWKKIQLWTGFEPWPLRRRCSAPAFELSGELGPTWVEIIIQFPDGQIAELVEHCTGIAEVRVRIQFSPPPKLGKFALSFDRPRHTNLLKCSPHVQHDYFPWNRLIVSWDWQLA